MSVYNYTGDALTYAYDVLGTTLQYAYDVNGNEVLSGDTPEEPWVKTLLRYDTNHIITDAWLANATIQRNAVMAAYSANNIPFFIQTDGHGKMNEGNKGCHNLAEETMRYIANMQLGDWASYYSNGANAAEHISTSNGITNYLPVMGNHEFLKAVQSDPTADLTQLVASFVPLDADYVNPTYGYWKKIDIKKHVKYIGTQPHVPDDIDSSGFVWKIESGQYEWLISELEADDGYDIVILQHEPLNGTYTKLSDGTTTTVNFEDIDIGPILAARKAKTAGSYTDSDGITHAYDFTGCATDLLCSLHGHMHSDIYMTKATYGFPVYVGDDFDNDKRACYGLIDRDNGKLKIWRFGQSGVENVFELEL